jgi:hypothetical protein
MAKFKSASSPQIKSVRKRTGRKRLKSGAARATARYKRHDGSTSQRRPTDGAKPKQTKKQICLDLLTRAGGASLDDLQRATGWQRHSIRGFLSRTVRKMPGITLTSDTPDDSPRHYRIVDQRKRARS